MRIFGLLLFVALCGSLSFSQVPNAGFEYWETDLDSNYNPVGWQTTNSFPVVVNVEPFAPGCQGIYSMKVKTVDVGFPFPGVAIMETSYVFSQRPARFSACVASTIMPGDEAFIILALMNGDSVVASTDSCTFRIDSTITQPTYLEFPIRYISNLVPDSIFIMVASGLGGGQVGTELIVDEVEFLGTTDVSEGEVLPSTLLLHQNYPNPFNPTTVIHYELPVSGYVSLKVYNLLGQEVATLVNREMNPSAYEVTWDASKQASGLYLYRLTLGDRVETRKMILLK